MLQTWSDYTPLQDLRPLEHPSPLEIRRHGLHLLVLCNRMFMVPFRLELFHQGL